MNAITPLELHSLQLVDIVDFKWLMLAEGVHVHVERLQRDPVYAHECLTRAAASAHLAVREAAQRLTRHLGLA
jgi:hypothetical protein